MNEILPSGEVVHLTDLKARAKKGAKQVQQSSVKAAVPAEQAPDGPSTAFRPSEPSSNQTEDVPRRILAEPDPVKRQKHRVFVKQTEEGIEEIDKKETIEPLQQDGATEDRQAAAKENHVPSQPAEADTNEAENPVSSPLKVHTPSTANDWQAYAGKQTDKADAPEVKPKARSIDLC